MANELRVPKLGMSMTEVTVVEWIVPDGASVEAGQAVLTVETDKVEQEIEAPEAGTLVHRAAPGDVRELGELLAEIL
jgi:pyruvate/2-oxoglutarate dehydrogenase complex dihydrolipoamide acyltransferase (E2) component